MSKLANIPAFPSRGEETDTDGMSLRQHYAGLAMQGILSSDHIDKIHAWQNPTHCAHWSVEFADALIAELEKGEARP